MARAAPTAGSPSGPGSSLVLIYLPVLCGLLASLRSRYFPFPIPQWGLDWWQKTVRLARDRQSCSRPRSRSPPAVTVIAVVLAFFGALAFARYDWRGRRLFQKLVLLPIFFPQSVLGLALLLWFNALGSRCPGRPRSSPIWSGSCRW